MKMETNIKAEETLQFMAWMTFVGGFINAYSFFIRGGAFVSFHTGNMMRLGIFLGQQDWAGLWSVIIPLSGCLIGVILANLLKAAYSKRAVRDWQILSLLLQFGTFIVVGFIPETVSHHIVNWVLSTATGFQLNNFRHYEGAVHNTTIATGNLRTFGQYVTELFLKRNYATLRKTVRSFVLVFSFPFGAFLGTLSCPLFGIRTIWLAALVLLLCWVILRGDQRAQQ